MVTFRLEELDDAQKINYRTLHHDIGLRKMDNGQWDLWFDRGDLVSATEFHSLQVGIIVACLTSWNYLNRYGNPTYAVFGNESYSLLKRNKGEDVRFKVRAYFEDCLNRMRRVQSVENLEVFEVKNNPYMYRVKFTVRAMSNYLISGEFDITTETGKSSSYINYTYSQPYASLENPLQIHIQLLGEYGNGLENEIVYVYVNDEFFGIKGHTDSKGMLSLSIYPTEIDYDATIRFEYRGNPNYNGCRSETLTFSTIPFHFNVDDNGMLYVTTNVDNIRDYLWLGEIISDANVIINEPLEWNKLYIVKGENNVYKAYRNTENGLVDMHYDDVILKSDSQANLGELHLFIEDGKKDGKYLYELEDSNNHIFYIGD